MSENVFNIIQIGPQSGTFAAPGAAAAAAYLFPVEGQVAFDLDRASAYPQQDRGRNARNTAGVGYHGLRAAGCTLPSQVRFEDIDLLLELVAAGGVAPSGAGPYTRAYVIEAVSPTLVPATIEGGNTDSTVSQQRLLSCLVNSLTLGFPDLTAPGAYPWTVSAEVFALDRETNNLTGSLGVKGAGVLETVQGHLTRLYEGTTATAFASLAELAGSLKSFTMTINRNLARRAYGSASDIATGFGFTDMTNVTGEAKVGISSTAKTDFLDIWNAAAPAALGERRWRVQASGTGTKKFTVDLRVGIMAVPIDDVDGERVFRVTFEVADDSTLNGLGQITTINSVA